MYINLITWQVQSYSLTNSSWFTSSFFFFLLLDFFSCCNSTMHYSKFLLLSFLLISRSITGAIAHPWESCASSFYFYLTPLALCFFKIICLGFVDLSCAIHNRVGSFILFLPNSNSNNILLHFFYFSILSTSEAFLILYVLDNLSVLSNSTINVFFSSFKLNS